jgi:hypothetical protein
VELQLAVQFAVQFAVGWLSTLCLPKRSSGFTVAFP